MGRKFTVYGLRFSKTSFWNRINTGFTDPAVATARTACGIETVRSHALNIAHIKLQQRVPLAVLKLVTNLLPLNIAVVWLQQRVPLAVLKRRTFNYHLRWFGVTLQQRVPLAVLKRNCRKLL